MGTPSIVAQVSPVVRSKAEGHLPPPPSSRRYRDHVNCPGRLTDSSNGENCNVRSVRPATSTNSLLALISRAWPNRSRDAHPDRYVPWLHDRDE